MIARISPRYFAMASWSCSRGGGSERGGRGRRGGGGGRGKGQRGDDARGRSIDARERTFIIPIVRARPAAGEGSARGRTGTRLLAAAAAAEAVQRVQELHRELRGRALLLREDPHREGVSRPAWGAPIWPPFDS
jgi:hypothetical protein